MGASNWYLFFGAVLCCTGIGLPVGIFMFLYWFYKDFMDRGLTVKHVQEENQYPTYGKEADPHNEDNYSFKGNIGDLRNKEEYT